MYQNLITINLRDFANDFKKELAKVEQEEMAQAFQNELQAQNELQSQSKETQEAQSKEAQNQTQNQAQITQNTSLFSQEELKPSFKAKKSFDEIMNQRLKNQK